MHPVHRTSKALQIGGAAAVGATVPALDQILRGEPLAAEWWIDLPLAAAIAMLLLGIAEHETDERAHDPEDALEEVMLAVSRGGHVHDVLESLTRQACRIMHVERSVVVLRDETDPRSALVVAGHGVPRD